MCENEHDPSYPYFSPMDLDKEEPFRKRISRSIFGVITRFVKLLVLWLIFLYAICFHWVFKILFGKI